MDFKGGEKVEFYTRFIHGPGKHGLFKSRGGAEKEVTSSPIMKKEKNKTFMSHARR